MNCKAAGNWFRQIARNKIIWNFLRKILRPFFLCIVIAHKLASKFWSKIHYKNFAVKTKNYVTKIPLQRTDASTKTGPLFTTYSLKSSGPSFAPKNFRPLCFLLFRQECSLNPPPYFLTLVAKLRKIWFWCTTLGHSRFDQRCRHVATKAPILTLYERLWKHFPILVPN